MSDNFNDLLTEISSISTQPRSIKISGSYIDSTLPKKLFEIDSIESITIQSKNLTEIPASIASSPRLKKLSVNQTQITKLPKEVYKSTTIEELIVSYNKISEIDEEIQNMKSLRRLGIDFNELEKIPDLSGIKLETLSMQGNRLGTISPQQLPKTLKALLLGGQIEKNPDFSEFSSLEMLTLNDTRNAVEEIHLPQSIKRLSVNSPKSTSPPRGINNLPNLETLRWNGGKLSQINAHDLPALYDLTLSNCNLPEVPEWIAKLPSLRNLDLSENCIEVLPDSFNEIKRLQELKLFGNPISKIGEHALDSLSIVTVHVDEILMETLRERFPDLANRTLIFQLANTIILL